MLDDRAKLLLKTLVERYIAEGQPVGSRTLSRSSGLDLSPATIRNVMSDLESLGLIASPHTSAGRVPTARGYRLFVDTMLTAQREHLAAPSLAPDQPQRVIANAAHLLSNLSQFVGVVMAPRRSSVFKQIEFLRLSDRRLLVIIVSPEGDVQNRVIFPEADYSQSQLVEAANYINAHYAGLTIEQVRDRLQSEVDTLRGEIADGCPAPVFANAETHWWDGSQVYGSGKERQSEVRTFVDGKVKVDPNGRLPESDIPGIDLTGMKENYWVGTGLLHTMFAREHNAVCDALKKAYPSFDDQRLFEIGVLVGQPQTAFAIGRVVQTDVGRKARQHVAQRFAYQRVIVNDQYLHGCPGPSRRQRLKVLRASETSMMAESSATRDLYYYFSRRPLG